VKHSLLLVPLFVLASCNADQPKKSAINVLGGMRTANNNDFDEVDDPIVWGGELLIGLNRRGLGVEGGYMRAEDDDDVTIFSGSGDGEVVTNELFAGVRNTWNTDKPWQPYIGGGVSWVDTAVDVDGSFSDDDDDIAPYARAGIGYQFNGFQVGLDARVLFATDMEFNGEESDIDYRQIVATLGWSW
jgi:hypothetical protein